MATATQLLAPDAAQMPDADGAALRRLSGANPVLALQFDATTSQSARWPLDVSGYTPGSSVLVDVFWMGDTGSAGDVQWGVALAAVTPDTDAGALASEAAGTEDVVSDTHLGTTAQRLHVVRATLSGAELDALAAGDAAWLTLRCVGGTSLAGPRLVERVVVTLDVT